MTRRTRALVLLLAAAGIIAAYVVGMWWFGEWTHKLVYEDHNDLAIWLIVGGGLACVAFYELWTTGEIRWSKTKAWRPKWNRTPTSPPPAAPPVLELRPNEYRRERPE